MASISNLRRKCRLLSTEAGLHALSVTVRTVLQPYQPALQVERDSVHSRLSPHSRVMRVHGSCSCGIPDDPRLHTRHGDHVDRATQSCGAERGLVPACHAPVGKACAAHVAAVVQGADGSAQTASPPRGHINGYVAQLRRFTCSCVKGRLSSEVSALVQSLRHGNAKPAAQMLVR